MTYIRLSDPPYLILIRFFANLPYTRLDAAFGLISLGLLYTIQLGIPRLAKKSPRFHYPLFYFSIMRNALVIVLGTLVSFIINVNRSESPICLVQTIPAGFDAMAVPSLNLTIISQVRSSLPPIVIILLLEHITVAKAFGKVSNYTICSNQEILAIGFSNVIGAFFG